MNNPIDHFINKHTGAWENRLADIAEQIRCHPIDAPFSCEVTWTRRLRRHNISLPQFGRQTKLKRHVGMGK